MLVILLMLSISSLKLFRYDFLISKENRATIGTHFKHLTRFAGGPMVVRYCLLAVLCFGEQLFY